MESAKEFIGRSLDEAIKAACDYFDLPREKLEVEIVNDAKSGIFGLVGAKKAKIKARKSSVDIADTGPAREGDAKKNSSPTEDRFSSRRGGRDGGERFSRRGPRSRSDRSEQEIPSAESSLPQDAERGAAEAATEESESSEFQRRQKRPFKQVEGSRPDRRPRGGDREGAERVSEVGASDKPFRAEARPSASVGRRGDDRSLGHGGESNLNSMYETEFDDIADIEASFGDRGTRFEDLDAETVKELVKEAVARLTESICPDAPITVSIEEGRVEAYVDCGDVSGLLIGRDGQTLSALQYMASRIVSSKMKALVHVNLDTGDYKERQEQKLKALAAYLADKARNSSRTQSTRPLSSYHRRIVHMVLQGETDIETRSKGDGPVKRVYIYVKK